MKKDRIEEARAILAALEDARSDLPIISEAISKMKAFLALCVSGQGDYSALLRNGKFRLSNRNLLAMSSTFSQQINGLGVIGFCTMTILEELLGLSPITASGL